MNGTERVKNTNFTKNEIQSAKETRKKSLVWGSGSLVALVGIGMTLIVNECDGTLKMSLLLELGVRSVGLLLVMCVNGVPVYSLTHCSFLDSVSLINDRPKVVFWKELEMERKEKSKFLKIETKVKMRTIMKRKTPCLDVQATTTQITTVNETVSCDRLDFSLRISFQLRIHCNLQSRRELRDERW